MNKRKVILLLLFIAFNIGTTGLFAQKVSKTFKQEPLKAVLKEVEKQTGYSIIYKTDEVNEKQAITSSFNEASVSEVLNKVLDDNLTFSIENKMIVIYQKGKSIPQQSTNPNVKSGKEISGTVTDDKGEPIIGASVKVKGTTNGMTTNFNGAFTLKNVPENANIEITYIGMQPQSLSVAGKSSFNITMKDDARQLEEVVITAMGIERKAKSLTYATQKMNNEDLMRVQDANFINSLQGKAAGLTITPNAGGAGGSSKILLRGNKSIMGNNTPLIVVDGIPMSNPIQNQQGIGGGSSMGYGFNTEGSDALSSINPDDIENINILKGANAAALYGSAAANGVLMITTKKGKEGSLSINFSTNATVETPLLLPKFQDTYGGNVNTVTGQMEANSWGKIIDGKYQRMSSMTPEEMKVPGLHLRQNAENDARNFFKPGTTFNNSISLSGGTGKMRTYFSYGNTTANGMIENNTFYRHSISFRQGYQFFKDILNLDVALNYINQRAKNRPGGGTNQNPLYHLYMTPRNADMGYYRDNYKINDGKWLSYPTKHLVEITNPDTGEKTGTYKWVYDQVELTGPKQNWLFTAADQNNPYWLTNMVNRYDLSDRVYGYVSANVKITKDLSIQGRYSMDRAKNEKRDEISATTQFPTAMIDRGIYRQWITNTNEFYFDWMLNYNKQVKDFSISASLGQTAHKITGNTQGMSEEATAYDYSNLLVPKAVNIFEFGAGSGGSRTYHRTINWDESLFFTGQVGYKDALYLEGSYRQDWYRAFKQFAYRGTPDNYGYFSLGANALVHGLVKLPDFITYLKLRTSYSVVGNSIPNSVFTQISSNLNTGATGTSSYSYFDDPVPEKLKSFESGFDVSFFKNSLNWDMTFYNTLLTRNYLDISNGAGKVKPVNTGIIRNRGVETTLSYAMNIARNMVWKTGVNFSYNSNKILETYKDKNGNEALITQGIGFGGKFYLKYTEGGKYGDLYATDFMRDANGKIILTGDGRPRVATSNAPVGNMNAPVRLGWNNNFTYKNFSLYFLIDGKIGGKVVSFTEAFLDRLGQSERTGQARIAAENDNTLVYIDDEGDSYPALRMPDGQLAPIRKYYEGIGGDMVATQYVYNATNFRLREISLGYTFRNLFGPTKNLSISAIGRNLAFLYNKAPMDPDTSLSTQNGLGGFDIFNMPTTRSFGLSATVNF